MLHAGPKARARPETPCDTCPPTAQSPAAAPPTTPPSLIVARGHLQMRQRINPGAAFIMSLVGLHAPASNVYHCDRAEATRSSNPQRGLIQTDPSLWVVATPSVNSSGKRRPAHAFPLYNAIRYQRGPAPLAAAPVRRPLPRGLREEAEDVLRDRFSRRTRRQPGRCASATGPAPTPSGPPPGWARRPATTRPPWPSETASARRPPPRAVPSRR